MTITLKEAAAKCGITPKHFKRSLIASRLVRAYRPTPRRIIVDVESLEKHINRRIA